MDSMQNQEFIRHMMNLGMTENESKVYFVVFQLKSATIREIYELSGVPRTKIYGELESLKKKGFVAAESVKPLRYSLVDISRSLDALRKATEETYDAAEAYLKSLEKEVPASHGPRAYELQTKWAIDSHLATILKRTKKELVFIVNSRDFFLQEVPEHTLRLLAKKTDLYVIVMKKEMAEGIPVRCYRLESSLVEMFNADTDTSVINTLNGMLTVISDRQTVLTVDSLDGGVVGAVLFMQGKSIINLLMGNILRYLVKIE